MNLPITVTQNDLMDILINVAPSRPVFIWGAPGIGKPKNKMRTRLPYSLREEAPLQGKR